MSVCVCTCVYGYTRWPEEDTRFSGLRATGGYQLPSEGLGTKSCPLKEQQVHLTAKPSLQPLVILKWLNNWWLREFKDFLCVCVF